MTPAFDSIENIPELVDETKKLYINVPDKR